jgi:imidazole glycerol-phosphate synthase subunit HisH
MNIAIIDYNAGNVQSVLFALQRLGLQARLTNDPEHIRQADKVIFPGVGEANTTMAYLRERGLDELIRSLTQPVLGICLGMQLLCQHSEENDTDCLGIIPQPVLRFQPEAGEKIPHMGWNSLHDLDPGLFQPDQEGGYVYFVHSYYVPLGDYTIATTDYVLPFSAALRKGNFWAMQFHPEKSGKVGERLLLDFLGA